MATNHLQVLLDELNVLVRLSNVYLTLAKYDFNYLY